ncbi:Crp/Fnr family transcriptional regulator [Actinokineospora sp. HUAS TT18]|uniref:Crp/Fnr family transcriptional regulator n=1 Tax=Actinokineospora sp. HUAS TT18 TaxID=3447451 RepID=UPI003F520F10
MDARMWPSMSLLGRLPAPARAVLLELGTEVGLPTGRRILRQGEPGDAVYVLLAGAVKVSGIDGDREPLLAIRRAGDVVGEMAVLLRQPRSATVATCMETVARVIPGADFRTFLRQHPDAWLAVASVLSERLRWANDRRVDFAALDARARVCRVLVTLAEQHGQAGADGIDLGVPLTQEDIASLAGVRLTTAEKTLRALARQGLLKLGYRSVVVLDLDGLREAAHSG